MSKIVKAVNAMISNPQNISSISIGNDGELFFKYLEKYKWSMRKSDQQNFFLYFYPGQQTISQLALMDPDEWQHFEELVVYRSDEIGTREAQASFSELFTLLKESKFGVNKMLDEIIDTDLSF